VAGGAATLERTGGRAAWLVLLSTVL
jgi:hypothetical protein